MSLKLANVNAVIVAHQFNPSIVSQLWLVAHGLLGPDDFESGCIFTDGLVQVTSREFNMLLTPDQCQFSPRTSLEHQQQVVVDRLGAMVQLLPHIPYRGFGLNFTWHASDSEEDVKRLARSLFFVEGSRLHDFFRTPDSRFGGYLSQDRLGFRLRLDAKPGIGLTSNGEKYQFLQFAFNFHLDLSLTGPVVVPDPARRIVESLVQWNAAYDLSKEIAEVASGMEIE